MLFKRLFKLKSRLKKNHGLRNLDPKPSFQPFSQREKVEQKAASFEAAFFISNVIYPCPAIIDDLLTSLGNVFLARTDDQASRVRYPVYP